MPAFVRSDVRGSLAGTHIVPQTTRIPLSERFRLLESRRQLQQPPAPQVRPLQLALQSAGQVMMDQPHRLPVRQRLGPRPGVRARNKHLQVIQSKTDGRKRQQQRSGVTVGRVKQRGNPFPKKQAVVAFKKQTANGFASARAFKAGISRFKWQNPNLVLKQAAPPQARRPAKASKEQLDKDLESYMSQSRGHLHYGWTDL